MSAAPSPNPSWKRPWIDVEAEIGRRVDDHQREKARRERLKLLASRALAIAYVLWCLGWLTVGALWVSTGLVILGFAVATALVAACIRVAAALPREPRGALVEGPGRIRRRGGAA
jgi:hypothetical protein